jgi:hypothetical protein
MTTALDIIKGALRRISSYQSGEQIAPPDEQDCLDTLNDMLDSWSIDKLMVYGSNETILEWQAGKNQYTIGNPTCTSIGEPPFTGTVTRGSNVITNVTKIPTDLFVGATLTDLGSVIPLGTTVTAVGTNSVTMSASATSAFAGQDQITYTIPGDFAIDRPVRITAGFTRMNGLDFDLDVYASQDEYTSVLYKAQPGPWPTIAWYNNTMPYGILNVYQTPGQNAEVHLFIDTILNNLTATQTLILPQGYTRALKWCLAKEMCAEFGFPITDAIRINAAESVNLIKALNAKPATRAKYDREISRGNRPDGGWIIHGGYR